MKRPSGKKHLLSKGADTPPDKGVTYMAANRNRTHRTGYRYSSYSYGYNYGSTARAYSGAYEKIKPEKEKRTVPRAIKVEEYGHVHRAALIGVVLCFGVLAIAFLCLYGYNYKMSADIGELQTELNELKEDNYYLESDFDNNLNLDYIEEYAINKLGMQKPSSYQIKYISVPKQSYTILYNTDEQESGVLSYLKDLDFKSAIKSLIGA